MNSALLWRTVWARVSRHRLRSFLMGLGIALGVAATVLLQTVAQRFETQLRSFVERAYPADGIAVFAGGGPMSGGRGPANLRIEDLETIAASLSISTWDPVVFAGRRDVQREGVGRSTGLVGRSERAELVRRRSVSEGEFFNAHDVATRSLVALLGSTTAKALFPAGSAGSGESAVGQTIAIDNLVFEVRGVLESIGADPHGGDLDDTIWIPYTTLMDRMSKSPSVSGATFIIEDPSRLEEAASEMTRILREEHAIGEGQREDFTVITPRLMRDMVNRSMRMFSIFLPLILGTVFLIAALVIWSVQQSSVKARVAEIGLRKAVGARARDVRNQILLEVGIVSVLAAVAGGVLALGAAAWLEPMAAAKYGVRDLSPSALAWLTAVTGALLCGVLGALLPARKAARLQPVQALRDRR